MLDIQNMSHTEIMAAIPDFEEKWDAAQSRADLTVSALMCYADDGDLDQMFREFAVTEGLLPQATHNPSLPQALLFMAIGAVWFFLGNLTGYWMWHS